MKKIVISIVGPTATGKTEFALKLAQELIAQKITTEVLLIGADSKQVYQGLEILSGADIPNNFKKVNNLQDQFLYSFFQHNQLPIQIHGVSIIDLQEEWSVAHFVKFASRLIDDAFSNNKLPIVVGGTGFYHQQLFQPKSSLAVKPNQEIREEANQKNTEELQKWLNKLNPKKLTQMNNSDINNPRRLIRAIEIELNENKNSAAKNTIKKISTYQIGLKNKNELIKEKIEQRIEKRLTDGAIKEVKGLIKLNLPETSTVKTATGIDPLSLFLDQQIPLEEAKNRWKIQETQYAKRQITWFKQHTPDKWIDSINDDQQIEIQKIVNKFVNNNNDNF